MPQCRIRHAQRHGLGFVLPTRLRRPFVATVMMAVGSAGCAGAGRPPRPDYHGAVIELRQARRLLEEPAAAAPIAPEEQAAVQIDTAVALMTQRVDKHRTTAPVVPEPASDRVERVHYALRHLDAARLLLTREEYDSDKHAVRNEAISCIARAEESLGRTLEMLVR